MPVEYKRDDACQRIVAISTGVVTRDEALAMMDRQAAEGAWSYGVLYDARQSTTIPTPDDIRALLRRVGVLTTKYGPRGPVALVVKVGAAASMGRAYATLGDLASLRVHVFASIEDAERWLHDEA
jgi:hypothetical protein